MKNVIIILMLLLAFSCKPVKLPYTYKIVYLESGTVAYTNKIQQFDEFPQDAVIYKYINGKYLKVIQVYE